MKYIDGGHAMGDQVSLNTSLNGSYTGNSNVAARKKDSFYNVLLRSLYDKNPPISAAAVSNLPALLSGSSNVAATRPQ